jgi:hypothetical protein
MFDLKNNIKTVRSFGPVAKTTVAIQHGVAVDTLGYESVTFKYSYGAITATDATLTPTVMESDAATGGFTSIANADLIGTEAAAGVAAATPRTSGTTKFVAKTVGYRGIKRYVRASITSTVTAATIVSADVLLGHPKHAPAA